MCVSGACRVDPESPPQCRRLRRRKAVQAPQDGPQKLVQTGERQSRLKSDASGAQNDRRLRCKITDGVEKRRLARTSLPNQHEGAALTPGRGFEETNDTINLIRSTVQHP